MSNKISLPKIRISISEACQLKCSFCGGNESKMENFQPCNLKPLAKNELKDIILSYLANGGKYVQFTGGEPLLNKDLPDYIKLVQEAGGIPEVNTNGIALTKEKALQLKESGLKLIKVSIPSFEENEYKTITGVDTLGKVISNVSNALNYLSVRINVVATRDTMRNISSILDEVKKLGVNQVVLLEYLYYPHVSSKEDFIKNHVDVIKEYGDVIKKLYPIHTIYTANNLFEMIDMFSNQEGNFTVCVKQARTVMRLPECYNCPSFCQEGAYELRLSTGGYLSFCNITNSFGKLCSGRSFEELNKIFCEYQTILFNAKRCDNNEFYNRLQK